MRNTTANKQPVFIPSKKWLLMLLFAISSSAVMAQAVWDNSTFVHRNNQKIMDGQNNVIQLDGVNLGGWLMWEGWIWGGGYTAEKTINSNMQSIIGNTATAAFKDSVYRNYITRDDIRKISEECFNVVRIPFNHTLLEDDFSPYIYKPEGWAVLDSVLNWCEEYNVYAVLDLHSAPGGQSISFTADPDFLITLWNGTINQKRTKRLWKAIADRYKDKGIVAGYDLLNEPDVNNDSIMLQLYDDIIDSIRLVDTNHMLFIEGNGFAQDFSMFTSLPDPNMCFEFHIYSWFYNNAPAIAQHIEVYTDLSDSLNVPIWCGEWGENDLLHLDTTLQLFNDPLYNVSGNAFWTWKKMKTQGQYPYYIGIDSTSNWNKSITWMGNTNAPEPTVAEMQSGISDFITNMKLQHCSVNASMSELLNGCAAAETDETELNNYQVYPNPFTNEIVVDNALENDSYEMRNASGQLIWSRQEIGKHDFSYLATGVYFLRISNGNSTETIRLMKH